MNSEHQQVLKKAISKAISKAIENGWDVTHFTTLKSSYKHPDESEFHDIFGDWHNISPLDAIFNHQFCKALWGEGTATDRLWEKQDELTSEGRSYLLHVMPNYIYHLQQMVIAEDPIEYLGLNI